MQQQESDATQRRKPAAISPLSLNLRSAHLTRQVARLINMLCDDPTDPELVEIEGFIQSARGRH